MIDELITTLTSQFRIDEGMAKHAVAIVMRALAEGGEQDLVDEMFERISGLQEVSTTTGGLKGGLIGLAGGIFGGGSQLASLAKVIGQDKMAEVNDTVSRFVEEKTDDELADRFRDAVTRLST